MLKNTKDIIFKIFFSDYSYRSLKYSCPIRLVSNYILPATFKVIFMINYFAWKTYDLLALILPNPFIAI